MKEGYLRNSNHNNGETINQNPMRATDLETTPYNGMSIKSREICEKKINNKLKFVGGGYFDRKHLNGRHI